MPPYVRVLIFTNLPTVSSPCWKDRRPQWRRKPAELSGQSCRLLLLEYTNPSIPRMYCLHACLFACFLQDGPPASWPLLAYPICSCPGGRFWISFAEVVLVCHRQKSTELDSTLGPSEHLQYKGLQRVCLRQFLPRAGISMCLQRDLVYKQQRSDLFPRIQAGV